MNSAGSDQEGGAEHAALVRSAAEVQELVTSWVLAAQLGR